MLVLTLWKNQPGKFFCISTKSGAGVWKDHFFAKSDFDSIPNFIKSNEDKDLYFCPHGFNQRRRRKVDAEIPKLLWADLDEADPRTFDTLIPTLAWESSPGRYVGIWVVDGLVSEDINRRLSYTVKADKGGWDFTQVLRVPNTYNYKYSSRPKVKVLWVDGPTYKLGELESLLVKVENKPNQPHTDNTAHLIYKKYEKHLSSNTRRELLRGKPIEGKRSEVLWKLVHALIQAGASKDEAFELLRVSPWNKFKNREDGDEQLQKALDKALGQKLNGVTVSKSRADAFEADESRETENYVPKFLARNMADVEEEELDWLWYPYLARGELSILEGDPGLGKSYMAQMVAKAIVDGDRLPSVKSRMLPPATVAYFDLENSAGSVTKKRLRNNGCKNLNLFFQEEEPFSVDDEDTMGLVYEALEALKPQLVVFDTLNTYMGKANTNNSTETQGVFKKFREIALRFRCSVLVLRHLTKNSKDTPALYRGQGSIAFAGLARVVMTVGHSPVDPEARVMAVTKINVTKPPQALSFKIEPLPDLNKEKDRSVFLWGDFIDVNSDQILTRHQRTDTNAKDLAIEFLRHELKDGPKLFPVLVRLAEAKGLSIKTLYRASEELGIVKSVSGFGSRKKASWSLPD